MEIKIEGRCVVTLEYKEGQSKSNHVATDFNLDVSENLDREMYLDKDDMPTKEGVKALSQCFIQGLIGNIHYAHEKGYRDSAEHLRYIISELERGFIEVPNVSKDTFNK